MEGDHGQTAPGAEQGFRRRQAPVELAEFVVDVNAQGLEGAGGGIDAVPGPGDDAAHQVGQLAGPGDGRLGAGLDDGPGDAPGCPFPAVPIDNVGEFLFARVVDHVGRGPSHFVHAHVEGAVGLEGKAARRSVQLHRRQAQIQGNAVHPVDADTIKQPRHVAVAPVDDREAARIPALHMGAAPHRIGVAVDTPDRAPGGLEDGFRISPGAEGGVHVDGAVAGGQNLQHLAQHHRRVGGRRHG